MPLLLTLLHPIIPNFLDVFMFSKSQLMKILLENKNTSWFVKNMFTFVPMNITSVHITSISRINKTTTSPVVRMLLV
jgi:hypothetical protein